ncbi:hypothetical protein BaRGS_00034380 [Batillaria attramentaria]|uniref:Zinc finger matrin-type protein 5 n=1 Tax=Batillaria attramentaria TaxID=370345 RepID=A0ABD0JIT2_9CAEN
MGKRFYCDFCDKSFADNPSSKKNHLSGVFHQRMRKAHYDAFRDPMTILAEEAAKRPCRSFQQTGFCNFGDGCRFSHLTEERKRQLEEECLKKKQAENGADESNTSVVVGDVEDWLAKHTEQTEKDPAKKRRHFPKYSLPPALASFPNLPPSLLPPTKDDFVNLPLLDWG